MRDDADDDVGDDSPWAKVLAALPLLRRVARAVMWLLFAGVALLLAGFHAATLGKQTSAIQQAALSADTAVNLIAGYVICRAIDAALLRGGKS